MENKLIRIAECEDFSIHVVELLKLHFNVNLSPIGQTSLKQIMHECDIFWFRLGYKLDSTILSPTQRCKTLVTPVTGIDHIDEDLCNKYNITIICLRGEVAFLRDVRATAELTIGMAISLMRNLIPANKSVKNGFWKRDLFRGNELYNKTIGIIGYGRLGSIVAKYAQAFEMNIIVFDPNIDQKRVNSKAKFVDSIFDIASQSDLITIHVSYNKQSHNLLEDDFFKACKNSAYLINTSRGGIINENSLLTALNNKWIKGAAIDVITNELHFDYNNPLVKYSLSNNNLIITPHIGGNTFESFEKTELFIANKLIKHFE